VVRAARGADAFVQRKRDSLANTGRWSLHSTVIASILTVIALPVFAQVGTVSVTHPAGITVLQVEDPQVVTYTDTARPPVTHSWQRPGGRFRLLTGPTAPMGGDPTVAGDEDRAIASAWSVSTGPNSIPYPVFTSKLTVSVDGRHYDMHQLAAAAADVTGSNAVHSYFPTACVVGSRDVYLEGRIPLDNTDPVLATEFINVQHYFTLIHDDVEDNDPERRHRPTVWKLWGVPHAINAGSHMQALVNAAALRLTACGIADTVVLEAVRLLTDCILELTEGQYLDISYEGRFDVTLDDYFTMTGGKTVALFELSCRVGALLATTDDPKFVEAWSQVGRSFGLAFQARDDTLGVWEKSAATGKVQAGDILKRKKSLPVVYALTHGSAQERQTIIDVFSQPDLGPHDVERVVQVLDRCGAPEYCARIMQEQGHQARAALDRLPDVPAVAQVRGLVEQVLAG